MPDEETKVTFGDLDFDTIEAAVMETARGRWFLKEYARRNRNADTQLVLEALERLRREPPDARDVVPFRTVLEGMAAAIRHTREEVRSFPGVSAGDTFTTLSEEEMQAAAEQRIRLMIATLQGLERQIHEMLALCRDEAPSAQPADGESPFEGEKARPLHRHPAFLM